MQNRTGVASLRAYESDVRKAGNGMGLSLVQSGPSLFM